MVSSTKSYASWQLVYFEEYASRSEAVNRETEVKKKKSRKYIQWLVENGKTRPD